MLKATLPAIIAWILAILFLIGMKTVEKNPTKDQKIFTVLMAVGIVCGGHSIAEHLDKKRRAGLK